MSKLSVNLIAFYFLYVIFRLECSVHRKINRPENYAYPHAAISTDRRECSNISAEIMRKGGNAVDAAITALLCIGLMNPQSSGLGGGGFMAIYMKESKTSKYFDFRESAPECVDSFMNISDGSLLESGGYAVAVPSEIFGMHAAWKQFGNLPWEELFNPVIDLANRGFIVGMSAVKAANIEKKQIINDKLFRNLYFTKGEIKNGTEQINNPLLGKYLRSLSKFSFTNKDSDALDSIYATMEKEVKERGGCLSKTDIESYQVKISQPTVHRFGKLKILVPQASSSGPVLMFMLNMLEIADFKVTDIDENPSKVYLYLVKVFGLAYKLRLKIGDPDFVTSVNEFSRKIMGTDFARETYDLINSSSLFNHGIWKESSEKQFEDHRIKTGTTHVSVIDDQGNAVSVMSTVNGRFGAKFTSKAFGFVYNNEMDDFSFPFVTQNEYFIPRSQPNFPAPKKRPLSSSAPLIVLNENDEVVLVVGAAGGSLITTAVAQVIMHLVIFGKSPREAVDAPRIHYQNSPNFVVVEPEVNKSLIDTFKKLGYEIFINNKLNSVVQLVSRENGPNYWRTHSYKKSDTDIGTSAFLYAESDHRKGGSPAGY